MRRRRRREDIITSLVRLNFAIEIGRFKSAQAADEQPAKVQEREHSGGRAEGLFRLVSGNPARLATLPFSLVLSG